MKKRYYILLFLTIFTQNLLSKEFKLQSPDKNTTVIISEIKGQISYNITNNNKVLVSPSILGILFQESPMVDLWYVDKANSQNVDETWAPVIGKRSLVVNNYNELELDLFSEYHTQIHLKLIFRAYNEGIAFRYLINSEMDSVTISTELSEINFMEDMQWWSYRKERPPLGPSLASQIDTTVNYPLLAHSKSGKNIAILEAQLDNYPWAMPASIAGQSGFSFDYNRHLTIPVPFSMPWRVIMIGETYGELIDSDLIANLNPKADPENFSWVKPGVSFWDWRAWGYKADDGFVYGLDLPSWKRFIDLAAETGVPYLLLDADWYGPEFSKGSNPLTGGKSQDVKAAIEYGRQKGVGLVLYLNHVAAKAYGVEKIIQAYAEWGAKGIKYGFMKIDDPVEKVNWTHYIVKLCAQNQLFVNFHDGPVPPTGEEATFPNFVHREFIHAQSDGKRVFEPGDYIKMVHVNTLAGPVDQNNGMFDMVNSLQQRPKMFQQLNSTPLAEAARTLITYSGGMTVIPDAADMYRKHMKLFRFISAQKLPWAESKTLDSQMGEYISMMRKSGDTYLVASVTDESARELTIDLSFLPPGKTFKAEIFSDTPETHYINNRMDYNISQRNVTSTDTIIAKIAPGSGHCMIIEPN